MAEESAALRKVREYRRLRDSDVEAEGRRRWTDDGELLHDAARDGKVEVVQYIVEEVGVSVEVEDRYGRRPLHEAALRGHLPVGEYLLVEGGADMEAEAKNGDRAIHLAALNGSIAFVEMLLEQGASADVENRIGRRPLHLAADRAGPSVVQCLLQRRAGSIDVNAQDREGYTALHFAASAVYSMRGPVEEDVYAAVQLLVEEGEADPLLRNEDGQRASDLAKDMEFFRVEKFLLEAEEMAQMQKQA